MQDKPPYRRIFGRPHRIPFQNIDGSLNKFDKKVAMQGKHGRVAESMEGTYYTIVRILSYVYYSTLSVIVVAFFNSFETPVSSSSFRTSLSNIFSTDIHVIWNCTLSVFFLTDRRCFVFTVHNSSFTDSPALIPAGRGLESCSPRLSST